MLQNQIKLFARYIPNLAILILISSGLMGVIKYGTLLLNSDTTIGKVVKAERATFVCKPFELCTFSGIRYRSVIEFEDNLGRQVSFIDTFPVTNPYKFDFGTEVKIRYVRGLSNMATVIVNTNFLSFMLIVYMVILFLGVRSLYVLNIKHKRK